MFTKPFDQYVCDGDSIRCEVDGFDCVARLVHDDYYSPADGDFYNAEDIARWNNDEWHFIGVCVTAGVGDIQLTEGDYDHSLWGLEANLTTDHGYLLEVANELLPDAIREARATLARINARAGVAA